MRNIYLLVILLLLPLSTLYSQEEISYISYSGNPRKYVISDIEVVGVENLDAKILVNLSGLKVGQTVAVPGDDISEAIRRYWNHGLFSDVKVYFTPSANNREIALQIYLQERPRMSDINFHGLKKSEIETISGKVAMMRGSQVTPFMVARAEKYVTNYFVEKGFYNTTVNIVQKEDATKPNQVILDVYVDKKEKVKVKSLVFEGNEVLSYNKLNRAMKKTNQKGKIRNFFRTKKFVKDKYEEDLIALIDKYNEEGYRDARVVTETVNRNDDNTVDVVIKVEEGDKYYIGNITWVGNSIYAGEQLSQWLRISKGDVFNNKRMDKRLFSDEDAVHNVYMDKGYLFSNITPLETNVHGDTIDLEMRIVEGPQATVNNVIIRGNTKTHEQVVRREIRTKPGQLFSKSELIRTVRELAQLGHFDPEKIKPDVLPDPDNGTVDLAYELAEKPNDQIELSGGWGAGMFVGSVGLKFSNFSMRNMFNKEAWRPLPSGDGQQLALRAQTNGKYYQSYSLSFTEPWLGGKRPNSLSVSLYHSLQTGVSSNAWNAFNSGYGYGYGYGYGSGYGYGYDRNVNQYRKVSGASLGFGKRLSWPDDYFTIYSEVGYQLFQMKNWYFLDMQNGNANILNFRLVLSRRSIDNPIYTRSGSDFSVGVSFTPPYSMFEDRDYSKVAADKKYRFVEYHKWNFKSGIYKTLDRGHKLVLTGKMEMGFLGYYNKDKKSPFEKFVVGGDGMSGYSTYGEETIGLRGYENSSITPRSANGYSYDGNIYNKLTMELRYPISLQPSATVYALTFLEAGNCWSDFRDFNPFELKRSAGAGLRIFLPIFGLLGIDWGYGFDDVNGSSQAGGSQFHFVIGQSF